MFGSKSSPADQPAPATAPTGDAAAAQRLTGTPTSAGAAPGTTTAPGTTSAPGATAGATSAPGGTTAIPDRPTIPHPGTANPPADTKPVPPSGPGVVKRTTSNVKRALLIVIGALAALFAVFNSQDVQVHWIFGNAVNTPLILVIAVAFVAGGLIGWIAAKLGGRSRTS